MAAFAMAARVAPSLEFCSLSSLHAESSHNLSSASFVSFRPFVALKHAKSHTLRMTTTTTGFGTRSPPSLLSPRDERRASLHVRNATQDDGYVANGGKESRPTGNQKKRNAVREFALKAFTERNALKIISGLQNFDEDNVAAVIAAADQGGATHVDIACDPKLVRMAVGMTSLPVCVSSIDPEAFIAAVEAGAHMVEIGNYDSFYKEGRVFSAAEVLELTCRTRQLLPRIALSVTVPHTLPLDEQVGRSSDGDEMPQQWHGEVESHSAGYGNYLRRAVFRSSPMTGADKVEGPRRSRDGEQQSSDKIPSRLRCSLVGSTIRQTAMAALAWQWCIPAAFADSSANSEVGRMFDHYAAVQPWADNALYTIAQLDPASAELVSFILKPVFASMTFLFIIRIIMSWYPQIPVNKLPYVIAYAPTEPVLGPTRRLFPPIGGVDISPVVWLAIVSFTNEILLGSQGLLVLLAQQQG